MKDKMFCPNPDCKNHTQESDNKRKWYTKFNSYTTKRLKKKIQRFICKDCGKTFSTQTFSIDYYVHKTIDYKEIEKANVTTQDIKKIAESKKVSPCVIQNRFERLSRQYIAYDSRNEKLCTGKLKYNLEQLYGKDCLAERFIITQNRNEYKNKKPDSFYKKRYFLTFESIPNLARAIWLQEYKKEGVFVPQFIAG